MSTLSMVKLDMVKLDKLPYALLLGRLEHLTWREGP
jgi:hypothetical protein